MWYGIVSLIPQKYRGWTENCGGVCCEPAAGSNYTICMRLQKQYVHLCARWVLLTLVTIAAFAPAASLFAQQSDLQPPTQQSVTTAAPVADPADPAPDDTTEAMFPHLKNTRFWLSGQANFVFQALPAFPALYSGTHSLGPNYEKATSRVHDALHRSAPQQLHRDPGRH